MQKSSLEKAFVVAYDKASTTFRFYPYFDGGDGRFDNLIDVDLGLVVGQTAASADYEGRLILVIGTPVGNAIAYQENPEGFDAIAFDAAVEIKNLTQIGDRLSADDIRRVFGTGKALNIGRLTQNLVDTVRKRDRVPSTPRSTISLGEVVA